jgi:hypothetical protein
MNNRVKISLWDLDFNSFVHIPRSGWSDRSYSSFTLIFSKGYHAIFHNSYSNLHSHQQCSKVLWASQLHEHKLSFILKNNSHFNKCEMISHCAFILHFSDSYFGTLIRIPVDICMSSFCEMYIFAICPFLKSGCLCFLSNLHINPKYKQPFLQFHRLSLHSGDCFLAVQNLFSLM